MEFSGYLTSIVTPHLTKKMSISLERKTIEFSIVFCWMPNEIFISWDLFEYQIEYIQRSLRDLNSSFYLITELLIEIYVCLY